MTGHVVDIARVKPSAVEDIEIQGTMIIGKAKSRDQSSQLSWCFAISFRVAL